MSSVGECEAVRAQVSGTGITAGPALDGLMAAEAAVARAELPSDVRERLLRFRGNAGFEPQQAHSLLFLPRRLRRAFVMPARRIAGLLHGETEIHHVRDHLRLTLRLHVAAHHAECEPRLAALQRKARDDRVEGPLAWRI